VLHPVTVGVLEVQTTQASAPGRSVHDVVVDEGEGVQQLEGGARIDDGWAGLPAAGGDETPVAKGRSESFASRGAQSAQGLDRLGQTLVNFSPPDSLGREERVDAPAGAVADGSKAGRHAKF
jgi:hypothetical protein